MSAKIIEIDINKDKIDLSAIEKVMGPSDIVFKFKATSVFDEGFVEFEQFKFGFFLKDSSGKTIIRKRFPEHGGSISRSYSDFLSEYQIRLAPDNKYSLMVYVEEAGSFYDETKNFMVGMPERPSDNNGSFYSWKWDETEKRYTPPTPQPEPTNEGYHMWDESIKGWSFRELIDQAPKK